MSVIEIIKLSSRLLYTEGKKCLFISLVHNRMHVVILMRFEISCLSLCRSAFYHQNIIV